MLNQLLCESHCVSNTEKETGTEIKLANINPSLTFSSDQKVIVAGNKCLINLITQEKSASASNTADGFDLIMEREGKVKHLSLYHEQRFFKLG